MCYPAQLLSRVRLFATSRTVAHQAPLSMEFSRQECWSGLPFPAPRDLSNPGIEPTSLGSPNWQENSLSLAPPGNHIKGQIDKWLSINKWLWKLYFNSSKPEYFDFCNVYGKYYLWKILQSKIFSGLLHADSIFLLFFPQKMLNYSLKVYRMGVFNSINTCLCEFNRSK